ncbi:MAG: polysaccharide biosynthesis/export family protein [Paracoccaceae bacterium]
MTVYSGIETFWRGARIALLALLALLPNGLAAAAGEALRLGPGDAISISVLDREDLSGVYALQSDGTISMHVLGIVAAEGLTLAEFEDRLEAALGERTRLPSSVTVAIARWRPVYVLGEVANPGAFDFSEGLTVQQAVALAGGLYRRATGSTGLELRLVDESERLNLLRLRLDQIALRRTRLLAEAGGAVEFSLADSRAGDLAELAEAERLVFQRRRETLTSQLSAAQEARALAGQEAEALAGQQNLLAAQIADQEQVLADTRALFENRLTSAERLQQEQRNLNADRMELMQAATFEARARQDMAAAEAGAAASRARLHQDVALELAESAAQERQTRLSIASAEAFLESQGATSIGESPALSFVISRGIAAAQQRFEAGARDAVHPGDTIEVVRSAALGGN